VVPLVEDLAGQVLSALRSPIVRKPRQLNLIPDESAATRYA